MAVIPALNKASENLTGYLGVISSDHAYVHKGLALTAVVNTGSISAAYKISFKTPTVASGKFIHWRPIGITTSADYCQVDFYEGDAFTGGTTVVPINRNRLSAVTSSMQTFAKGTTVTLAGTLLASTGIGTSGNPASQAGGGAGADQELVLKQDEEYSFLITPDGATTCVLDLFWYEEDGGIVNGAS
jgi:hypothetical protein